MEQDLHPSTYTNSHRTGSADPRRSTSAKNPADLGSRTDMSAVCTSLAKIQHEVKLDTKILQGKRNWQ